MKRQLVGLVSETGKHDAYSYRPRNAQGEVINEIRRYANSKTSEENAGRIRCGTFKELNFVCANIAAVERISKSKIYPALRFIGYNDRYYNYKDGNPDMLERFGDLVNQCLCTSDEEIMEYVIDEDKIFRLDKTMLYRINKQAIAIAYNDSDKLCIKVSELNLFNALRGLEVLVENEPTYTLLKDKDIFKRSIDRFHKITRSISRKIEHMQLMLH